MRLYDMRCPTPPHRLQKWALWVYHFRDFIRTLTYYVIQWSKTV